MYANRIRLYFNTNNANYISADKLINDINNMIAGMLHLTFDYFWMSFTFRQFTDMNVNSIN